LISRKSKEVEEHNQQFLKEKEQAVLAVTDLVNVRLSDERRHSYSGKSTDMSSVGIDLESSYNPSKSLYDTLSCETFERITAEQTPMDKKTRQKNLEDQRKLDAETFGVPQHYNSRYRGKNPRGQQNNNNNNNSKRQQHNPKDNNPSYNQSPTNTASTSNQQHNTGNTSSNKSQNSYNTSVPSSNRTQNKKYAQKVFRPVQRDVSTNEENQGEIGTTSQVKE